MEPLLFLLIVLSVFLLVFIPFNWQQKINSWSQNSRQRSGISLFSFKRFGMRTLIALCLLMAVSVTGLAQSATGAYSRDPIAMFGNFPGTKPVATIKGILENPKLITDQSGFEVLNFTISVLPHRGEYWGPFTVKGAELTQQIKDGLKTFAGRGGRIFIESIQAAGPDRRPRNMNSIILTYTN